ncbi:NUDIX hydrolase [Corallococcus exiguus]|uniref:NUDIX hydrolase n=1 Tax=Corallococcus exiguus TaxID=83462 RepID=UPI0015610220|nr:NUDIX hydrolase [Corallococcus exiguus]NRD44168.1 NUDIX hydrolase [Corallococcus exiguus]
MTDGRSWQGDWKTRLLYERVHERGYDSLTAFAEERPTASLVQLGVQVFSGLVAEAERSHQLTRLVRSQFVRELFEDFPDGWPVIVDDHNRFTLAHALARWCSYTPETHEARVKQVRDALLASPPPPGWRPLDPDDALLITLLPDDEA